VLDPYAFCGFLSWKIYKNTSTKEKDDVKGLERIITGKINENCKKTLRDEI
jgi:hypothetical protein